jgi:DNA-binding transcriptional ArsR family regulator
MDPWQAIADPTRRRILVLLREHELTAGEIAGHFASTRSAVSQHLAVLRAAGLVSVSADGRRRIYHLELGALRQVRRDIESFWTKELNELSREAMDISMQKETERDDRVAG